jgi:hypothetical protein
VPSLYFDLLADFFNRIGPSRRFQRLTISVAIGEERTWPDLSPPDWARVERAYVLSRLQALWSGQVDKIIIRSSRRVFAGIGAT